MPGGRLTLERLAPGGRFQHISAQYDARDDDGPAAADRRRPLLLAMTDGSCAIRTARRLHYDDDGRPAWLEWLDGLLEPTGEREELNPPVPDGADPGGVPVALVDTGVNYLLPAIAARLARDRDGALLGYDYWDLDRRPFDAHPVHSPFFPMRHGTQTASLLLAEAPVTRLLAYRYPRPDMSRMAALIEDAAAAGARLVNLSLVGNQAAEWAGFEAAARRHPEILFVVAAGNHGRDLDLRPAWPAALPLANLVAVTAAQRRRRARRGRELGARERRPDGRGRGRRGHRLLRRAAHGLGLELRRGPDHRARRLPARRPPRLAGGRAQGGALRPRPPARRPGPGRDRPDPRLNPRQPRRLQHPGPDVGCISEGGKSVHQDEQLGTNALVPTPPWLDLFYSHRDFASHGGLCSAPSGRSAPRREAPGSACANQTAIALPKPPCRSPIRPDPVTGAGTRTLPDHVFIGPGRALVPAITTDCVSAPAMTEAGSTPSPSRAFLPPSATPTSTSRCRR